MFNHSLTDTRSVWKLVSPSILISTLAALTDTRSVWKLKQFCHKDGMKESLTDTRSVWKHFQPISIWFDKIL